MLQRSGRPSKANIKVDTLDCKMNDIRPRSFNPFFGFWIPSLSWLRKRSAHFTYKTCEPFLHPVVAAGLCRWRIFDRFHEILKNTETYCSTEMMKCLLFLLPVISRWKHSLGKQNYHSRINWMTLVRFVCPLKDFRNPPEGVWALQAVSTESLLLSAQSPGDVNVIKGMCKSKSRGELCV